ncbi:MAG: hypothetical protein Q9214_004267 [Letrouitia sp. 1 TL-2023]
MEQGRDLHGGNHVAASVSQAVASVQLQRPPSHDNEDNQAAMEVNSTSSQSRDTSVLSMDDLEAAQALEVLRAESTRQPPSQAHHRETPSMVTNERTLPIRHPSNRAQEPEPLLSLLTSHHPFISSAINGSLSAYTSSKSYSPRFKYGAEFVERHIGTPVANAVSTASRVTRADQGVRIMLQGRDSGARTPKRRRIEDQPSSETDVEQGLPAYTPQGIERRLSELSSDESLPSYDDHRSPSYEESSPAESSKKQIPPSNNRWPPKLMVSTAGLGIAMREESLRSLRYCLACLRWGNRHLGDTLNTLKDVVTEYQQTEQRAADPAIEPESKEARASNRPRDRATIAQHIQNLRSDVLNTLKQVVDVVSTYTGGALPTNARELVRRHLISLPQRFHIASLPLVRRSQGGDSESGNQPAQSSCEDGQSKRDGAQPADTVTNAQKVILLATEGLDMMAQVSSVVDETIRAAEEWCARLGKNPENRENSGPVAQQKADCKEAGIKNPASAKCEKADLIRLDDKVGNGQIKRNRSSESTPAPELKMRDLTDLKT